MAFEKTVPLWTAQGVEPPASLKESGFTPGYKPPADYFNWFWSAVSACLTELQEKSGQSGDYLPIAGGTLTGKELALFGGYGNIYANETAINFETKPDKDTANRRCLVIRNKNNTYGENIAGSLEYQSYTDGTASYYKIYGDHNTTASADTVYTTPRIRNTALVSAESTPSQNGAIHWLCE